MAGPSSMNPCPHPVESAQRAARDITMAWARNLTLLDTEQGAADDGRAARRATARSDVPSPEVMAAKYLEVRDQILASPLPRPPAAAQQRPVPAEVLDGGPTPGGVR